MAHQSSKLGVSISVLKAFIYCLTVLLRFLLNCVEKVYLYLNTYLLIMVLQVLNGLFMVVLLVYLSFPFYNRNIV